MLQPRTSHICVIISKNSRRSHVYMCKLPRIKTEKFLSCFLTQEDMLRMKELQDKFKVTVRKKSNGAKKICINDFATLKDIFQLNKKNYHIINKLLPILMSRNS